MVGPAWDGFEEWYRAMHPRLLGVLSAVCGDVDMAAEATDEAFARALLRWHRVRTMASPDGWVYRVAINQIRRRLRRKALESRLWIRESPVEFPYPEGDVWDEVRRLPLRQRTAVVLRYVADLPEAEIATVMGISRGTVASTLADARRRMALRLGPESEVQEATRESS